MKLLQQTWRMNELGEWGVAAAIVLGVVVALMLARSVLGRVVKTIAGRAGGGPADIAVDVVAATRIWLLLPVAFYFAASALTLPRKVEQGLDTAAVIVLMLQAVLWANRFIRGWFQRQISQRRGVDGESVTVLTLLGIAARVLVWSITLLLVLDHLGFDITALVAGLGIGGVAVALAVQNILGDLFASLSIVLDKPFVVGDFIVVDSLRGTIESIGIKTTRIRSLDGELLVFSNADLLRSRIRNFKRMQERRVAFTVGVVYQTPLERVRSISRMLREIIESQPKARFDRAHFTEYGDSALLFEVVYYVLDPDYNTYMDVQQAINLAIFERFARERIEFAYPTRTLYLNPVPAAGAG